MPDNQRVNAGRSLIARLPHRDIAALEQLVADGAALNKSDAVRFAVRDWIAAQREQAQRRTAESERISAASR